MDDERIEESTDSAGAAGASSYAQVFAVRCLGSPPERARRRSELIRLLRSLGFDDIRFIRDLIVVPTMSMAATDDELTNAIRVWNEQTEPDPPEKSTRKKATP